MQEVLKSWGTAECIIHIGQDLIKLSLLTTGQMFNPKIRLIICGDFNINYMIDNSNKQQLHSLLLSYNLSDTLKFPTRICNKTCSIIDNIFIDYNKFNKFETIPIINGISDHDAQLLLIYDIKTACVNKQFHLTIIISSNRIASFVF
jgi:hypothetical protein